MLDEISRDQIQMLPVWKDVPEETNTEATSAVRVRQGPKVQMSVLSKRLQEKRCATFTYSEYAVRCPNCGHGYKHRSSLSKHIKWECGNVGQFKCQICSYTAKQKVNLIRHLKRVHEVSMEECTGLYP
ncbi:unnamed protein product [Acanthoscelides obtectus]|uniref:C2H2-type domain-containing protein n=1 Tax=Acanthoscelides obtectus TaxID=200917 RepID=A0A9P0K4M0_ACAOB|nr:unnamed protein product [Acanthoscelides obtectus]CAK1669703.1 Longitudinals lacking protein, isoforms A/B/D/L [Acanthoscelides obtectus]